MENKKLEEQIKSIMYVAVGAIATIAEKAKEYATEFEAKGKETCEKTEQQSEKLKQDIKEAVEKAVSVTVVNEESTEDFVSRMDKLSEEDLTKIKEKLAELEKKEQSE